MPSGKRCWPARCTTAPHAPPADTRDAILNEETVVTPQEIKGWIEQNLADSRVEIDGDGHHFEALVVCPGFAGKSRIQRHQMVYGALGDRMKSDIHALSMKTLTPEELASAEG